MTTSSAESGAKYVCLKCDRRSVSWESPCPQCQTAFSMRKSIDPMLKVRDNTILLSDYEPSTKSRIFTGFRPWDKLTSGMYPGSVYLLGGNKGLGKSTISLMIASAVNVRSLIVSAEETIESIAQRGVRTGAYAIDKRDRKVTLQQTSCTEDVFRAIDTLRPNLLIVDSMNKFKSESSWIGGDFGSGSQMKMLVEGVISRSRAMDMVSIVIGQMRSDGKTIAGPNMIQHDVDCVLIFMQDTKTPELRRGKATKNRWGPSGFWVTMAMTEKGLVDPSASSDTSDLLVNGLAKPSAVRSRFASANDGDDEEFEEESDGEESEQEDGESSEEDDDEESEDESGDDETEGDDSGDDESDDDDEEFEEDEFDEGE